MRMMKTLLCMMLALTCLTVSFAETGKVDLSHFREHPEAYVVIDLDGGSFVCSTLSDSMTFPLPDWGDDSFAWAYFVITVFDDGEDAVTVPALLISVFTTRPWNIQSMTIPVEDQAFTFSWEQSFSDYSETESGFRQDIHITHGDGTQSFIEAMTARGTSVTDPNALLSMPVEIILHGDEDCRATMNEGTMLDYITVVCGGYCYMMDGLNGYIDSCPGTPMTVSAVGEDAPGSVEAETAEASAEATMAEEASAEAVRPLTLEDMIGVWDLESVRYHGETIPVRDIAEVSDMGFSMEFTSDGLWILEGAGTPRVNEVNFTNNTATHDDGSESVRFENGKLVMEVTDYPGLSLIYVRSDRPGREASAAVNDDVVGDWVFEQMVTTGGELPNDISLKPDMFPMVFGVPAPTLRVRKGGLAMMTLGEDTVTFPAEEWQPEEGKLVYRQRFDDGTERIWYFVREYAGSAEVPAESAEAPFNESAEVGGFS